MANIYGAIGLIGGTSGFVDELDGTALADKDIMIAAVQGDKVYHYILDEDSGATENSPYIIAPDTNAGDKRWILYDTTGTDFLPKTVTSSPVTLTAAESKGHIILVTNAGDTTINIAAVAGITSGAVCMIMITTDYVLTINPDDSDRIRLNGVALSDGQSIYSSGIAGSFITLWKDSSDGLTVIGRSGLWIAGV